MEQPALDRANVGSPYADQLTDGFPRLRFNALLEKEFRDFFVAQNLPRGRLAMLVALVPLCTIAMIELFNDASEHRVALWGFGGLSPLLLASAGAMYLPVAKRLQTIIAGVSVLLGGLLITYFSHVAMLDGNTMLLGGQMLALL